MEVRLSKYNAPFRDSPEVGVHYISLDHQADMRLGRFDAHVRLFRSLGPIPVFIGRPFASPSRSNFFVPHDDAEFLKQFRLQSFSETPLIPFSSIARKDDVSFLDELAYKTKIRAASKRLSKVISFVPDKSKLSIIDIYKNRPVKNKQKISKAKQFLNSLSSKNKI